MAGAYSTAF
jgi:hypothetical protein